MSKPSDLVQGTLDLLILKILVLKPLNGWAIGQRLKQVSDEVLQVSDGSLYPALHKLEHAGWITAEWRRSENNRRGLSSSSRTEAAASRRLDSPLATSDSMVSARSLHSAVSVGITPSASSSSTTAARSPRESICRSRGRREGLDYR